GGQGSEPPVAVPEGPRGIGQTAALGVQAQALAASLEPPPHRADQAVVEVAQGVDDGLLLPHDELGGGRRRRRAQVRHEVGDREVDLVADAGDHRGLRGDDRARDDLLVEGPEVLERAAAPADDDHVDVAERVQVGDAVGDLAGGALTLDPDGPDDDVKVAEAAADDAQHVADGGAGRRGDDADLPRKLRERPLAPGVEEALGLEPRLELLDGDLERAEPLRLHELDDHLVFPAGGVDLEAPERQHVQAVLGLEADAAQAVPEEHDADLGLVVFEREVRVAGAGDTEIADLALDPERHDLLLE